MLEPEVLVIGGGPAGVAAAAELAELGFTVLLVEQRDRLGGAIHRAYAGAGRNPLPVAGQHRRNWQRLQQRLRQAGARISTRLETVYLGVDGNACFLLDDRRAGRVISVRPQATVLALGAFEVVWPRPGWELPGVTTVGAMQLQLKETGEPPAGSILVAGNGPLPLALAAQLSVAGNPPRAVLESGQPVRAALRHLSAACNGLRAPRQVAEAIGYGWRLWQAGVPYRTGATVVAIEAAAPGLLVTCQRANGALEHYRVRHLALHDGLACNPSGLPAPDAAGLCVIRAGDGREVLGAAGAQHDGHRAAQWVARQLGRPARPASATEQPLAAARRTQQALATLFRASAPLSPAPETVICRCEGLRRADFDALQGAPSTREIRLVGRFGMGLCQGRFCAHAVQALAAQAGLALDADAPLGTGARWPLRPVSLAALAAYDDNALAAYDANE